MIGVAVGAAARPLVMVLAVAAATAQVTVEVRLPEPIATLVAAAVRTATMATGAEVRVAAAGVGTRPLPGTVVIAIEPALQVLATEVELASLTQLVTDLDNAQRGPTDRWLLPWSLRYTLVVNATAARMAFGTFEALALQSSLHDRLALCAPATDPGPWLLGMQEFLLRGEPESAGFGLWTALDARVGAYCTDGDAALVALAEDRAEVAVVPRLLVRVRGVPTGCTERALATIDGLPLGLAVASPATAAALACVERLSSRPERQRLAEQLDLSPPTAAAPRLDVDDVVRWLDHFERRIRGQGRAVERVANVLDYVFTGLFVAIVLFVWLWQRRGKLP